MATSKQLYGREGSISINGVSFSPKQRHEAKCDACRKSFSEEEFKNGVSFIPKPRDARRSSFVRSALRNITEVVNCENLYLRYRGFRLRLDR